MGKSWWDKFCEFDDRMSQPALQIQWAQINPQFVEEAKALERDYNKLVDEYNELERENKQLKDKLKLLESKPVKEIEYTPET